MTAIADAEPMRILLLCHSFNSLSQRLYAELTAAGHELSVELDIADVVTAEAVALFRPAVVVAPFLKRRIPESVWRDTLCLIVHPGPPGDRGPSALDWAILDGQATWGVTVIEATGEFDAGPVWAYETFAMRATTKSSLYRNEVTEAAVVAVRRAIEYFIDGGRQREAPTLAEPVIAATGWRPSMPQRERAIDWATDDTAAVLAKLNSADGTPGVLDRLFGEDCRLYDGHSASAATVASVTASMPGDVVARRDMAILRRTVDGAIWLGHVKRSGLMGQKAEIKLPAGVAFAEQTKALPDLPTALTRADDEWGEIRYFERSDAVGDSAVTIGCLSFDFYNGAMSTRQCQRLLAAVQHARQRPTRLLLLLGGTEFFSNGIHLNCIEAAAHRDGDSAADESWRNINAMNDVAREVITMTDRLTIALIRGSAGAGGVFLALAADQIWARSGVILNAHYKNMGNLYGSEYWTYLLPARLGLDAARHLMASRLPWSAVRAQSEGLIDRCIDATGEALLEQAIADALTLAASESWSSNVARKQQKRADDERVRPLEEYRQDELSRMRRNFYGFDPSYHVARYHFVHKEPHAWTPRHLAIHRTNQRAHP